MTERQIEQVRRFNRIVTQHVGALEESYLRRGRPLGQARLLQNIALKRLGMPEDIAGMVMFFASDYAGWISGQVISVDGGK